MANDIHFDWDARQFYTMTDEIGPMTKRATMYAMRATGRLIARTAKAKAPVYKGTDDPRAIAESGALRKSIRNARRLDDLGGIYELKVGPFGTKRAGTAVKRHGKSKGQVRGVQLYRQQMEEMYGYMELGIAAADADARAVFDAAYNKAWARWVL